MIVQSGTFYRSPRYHLASLALWVVALVLGPLESIERTMQKLDKWLPGPEPNPDDLIDHSWDDEWNRCKRDPLYFVSRYCHIYDAVSGAWVVFKLWPEQRRVLKDMHEHRLVVMLKARQLGMTWLTLCFGLWLMIFHPAAEIGIFSRREQEANYMLSRERMRGVYNRLPEWVKDRARSIKPGGRDGYSVKVWRLSNGSVARAFPTSAGDSYSFTLVIADEFDLAPDQNNMMRATKPTIDNGGRMILLSRVDKRKPQTEFKRIYKAAKLGAASLNWHPVFVPWMAHPRRGKKWYEAQKVDILTRTGALDDLFEQYPATDSEALQGRTLDKRIAPQFLEQVFAELKVWPDEFLPNDVPTIPNIEVYMLPVVGRRYVLAADPAEGNPNSDPSAATVLDSITHEEMATIEGRWEITTFAKYCDDLALFYNAADILPERNNHGHAYILWFQQNSTITILEGEDGKPGWLTNKQGKATLLSLAADACRDQNTIVHSFATFAQLSAIDGSTLRAPEGEHDDRAIAHCLGIAASALQALNWLT